MALPSFNMDEKINRTNLIFTGISTALSLVLVSLNPFWCFYLSFAAVSSCLIFSYKKWTTLHDPEYKAKANESLMDNSLVKIGLGIAFVIFCVYFLQLNIIAQMVLAMTSGCILSLTFFNFVLKSQENLNERLKQAAREANVDHTKILLERGADPFAVDNTKNNAIFYAMGNSDEAVEIIKRMLEHAAKRNTSLLRILPGLRDLRGETEEERQHYALVWNNWVESIKKLFSAFSTKTGDDFLQTSKGLMALYYPLFPRMANTFILYLRHKIVHPNNVQEGQNDYLTYLRELDIEEGRAAAIKNALKADYTLPEEAGNSWLPFASNVLSSAAKAVAAPAPVTPPTSKAPAASEKVSPKNAPSK